MGPMKKQIGSQRISLRDLIQNCDCMPVGPMWAFQFWGSFLSSAISETRLRMRVVCQLLQCLPAPSDSKSQPGDRKPSHCSLRLRWGVRILCSHTGHVQSVGYGAGQ